VDASGTCYCKLKPGHEGPHICECGSSLHSVGGAAAVPIYVSRPGSGESSH